MRAQRTVLALVALVVLGVCLVAAWLQRADLPLLQTKGSIGDQQRDLMILGASLSLIVVIPVFAMLFWFVWRYREDNHKASYRPDWDHSKIAETVWWGVPLLLIGFLSIVTWEATHRLDPFRPIASNKQTMTIEVVALDWKWLFIYPEENLATVNYLKLPEDTPVRFRITADAPMNSFWIPELGGQMYAMSGMATELNLIANQTGVYRGNSANLSGEGFADMHFEAEALTEAGFNDWVNNTQEAGAYLDETAYSALAKPGTSKASTYAAAEPGLYDTILAKYHAPNYGGEMPAKPEGHH